MFNLHKFYCVKLNIWPGHFFHIHKKILMHPSWVFALQSNTIHGICGILWNICIPAKIYNIRFLELSHTMCCCTLLLAYYSITVTHFTCTWVRVLALLLHSSSERSPNKWIRIYFADLTWSGLVVIASSIAQLVTMSFTGTRFNWLSWLFWGN